MIKKKIKKKSLKKLYKNMSPDDLKRKEGLLTLHEFCKRYQIDYNEGHRYMKAGHLIVKVTKNKRHYIDGEVAFQHLIDGGHIDPVKNSRKHLISDIKKAEVPEKIKSAQLQSQSLVEIKIKAEGLKAKKLELEYQEKNGQLISVKEVEFLLADIIETTKSSFLNLAPRVTPLLINISKEKKVYDILEKEIRSILTNIQTKGIDELIKSSNTDS